MDKSIENIWQEGFVDDTNLAKPEVTDLYNQKSKSVVNRMLKTMKWNVIGVYIFSTGMLIYSYFNNVPIIPVAISSLLFATIGWFSTKQMKKLHDVDGSINSYDYLKNFQNVLRSQLYRSITLARFYYPAFFLIAACIVWFSSGRSEKVNQFLAKYPNHIMVGDIPLLFLLIVIIVTLLFFFFAKHIYMFDIKLVYGSVFKKLDNIIADLEELRG